MRRLPRFQTIVIVAVAALLVMNVVFVVLYVQKASARAGLESDIAAIEQEIAILESLPTTIDNLERELDAIEEELAAAPIPKEIDNKEVVDSIIKAAQKAKLKSGYTCEMEEPKTERIGENDYQAITYHMTTTERLSRLIKFLNLLEEDEQYNTLKIDNIKLSFVEEKTWDLEFDMVFIIQGE